jgi:arylsulfatase A
MNLHSNWFPESSAQQQGFLGLRNIKMWQLVLVILIPFIGAAQQNSNKSPNIVLIMADDLGYGSLGCYGNKDIQTPNIDRLAAKGMRFTDFHSSGTVCTPTRAALLTGRYPQRCEWVEDEELSPVYREQRKNNLSQRWAWGISSDEITIADLLKKAEYRTAIVGKWHLGYDFKFHPKNYGFDEFRGFLGGNVDYYSHVAGYGLKELDWWNGDNIENEAGYTTDLLTKYSENFISRQTQDKPFFLLLTHGAPHNPWQARDSTINKSPKEAYKDMIEKLDESVGKIKAALNNYGFEKNTLLIFCSDNGAQAPKGVMANTPLKGIKAEMTEGGHRVPFIASWPGTIPAGKINTNTVMSMDFFPTFLKLAKVNTPQSHSIDGIDIMPILKNKATSTERTLHWRFDDNWAVRKGPWKLIGQGEKTLSLVNVVKDISEETNQLNKKPELENELLELHQKWTGLVGKR